MLRDIINGGFAGLTATAPMTAVMRGGERHIPWPWGGKLPPRQITERLLGQAGVRWQMDEAERSTATTVAHYGFGASAGCLLGVAASQFPRAPRALLGTGVGLGVWAASYMGWLPLAGIRRPATEEPAERNAQMIAAHIVWGCVAGCVIATLESLRQDGEVQAAAV